MERADPFLHDPGKRALELVGAPDFHDFQLTPSAWAELWKCPSIDWVPGVAVFAMTATWETPGREGRFAGPSSRRVLRY